MNMTLDLREWLSWRRRKEVDEGSGDQRGVASQGEGVYGGGVEVKGSEVLKQGRRREKETVRQENAIEPHRGSRSRWCA